MKRLMILAAALIVAMPTVMGAETENEDNQGPRQEKAQKFSAVKQELQDHFSFYGFIRNYFAYDSRESLAGTGDLFYYLPKPNDYNEDGDDLNARGSFSFLSITTRLGVDVLGYKVGSTEIGAKVEADFYTGLTGSTGTALFRLRQAYATFGWNDLSMGTNSSQKASVRLLVGQAWHPLSADQPHVIGMETGAPFNPFSRTPQVLMDANLGKHFTISAAAIWAMQYISTGPDGKTADYMRYSGIPEGYACLSYKTGGFTSRIGFSVLSIKPRSIGENSAGTEVKVSDRMTGFNPFIYLQYINPKKNFEFKAKTTYSQAGDYLNLMGGYGITGEFDDGHWEYSPIQTSSTWASISYGKKWQFMFMAGYIKNLGATKELMDPTAVYFTSNGYQNLTSMWRILPTVAYNIGKLTLALEYNLTSARYGDESSYNKYGVATQGIHPVTNHRVQMMVKFTF